MHNFAEGLAIGQSAVKDDVALTTLLIVGFAPHNATEGFGIVAPLAGEDDRPSWATLGLLGVIAGSILYVASSSRTSPPRHIAATFSGGV